jgi:hypothetical protein
VTSFCTDCPGAIAIHAIKSAPTAGSRDSRGSLGSGFSRRPATEETFTIRPPPPRRMCGMAALANANGAIRFTDMTRSQSDSASSSARPVHSFPRRSRADPGAPARRRAAHHIAHLGRLAKIAEVALSLSAELGGVNNSSSHALSRVP